MARTKTAAPAPTVPAPATASTPTPVPQVAPATAPAAPLVPVAPPKAHPPATVNTRDAFVPRGLEEIDRSDIIIPRLTIVQPTSKEGKAGTFRDVVSDEAFPKLEGVIPLKFRKGRVFFEKPEDQEPRCASDDRVKPSTRIEVPVKPECAGCPMAAWTTDENGNRKHPKCQETYTLLLAFNATPYFLTLKSSAMRNVKRLLTQLKLQAQRHRRDIFGFAFDAVLEKVTFAVGMAYVPQFSNLKMLPDVEYASYASIFDQYAMAEPVYDPPTEAGGSAEAGDGEPEEGTPAAAGAPGKKPQAGFDFAS